MSEHNTGWNPLCMEIDERCAEVHPKLCSNNCRRINEWKTFAEIIWDGRQCEQLKLNWMPLVSTRCCGKWRLCALLCAGRLRTMNAPDWIPKCNWHNEQLWAIETDEWVVAGSHIDMLNSFVFRKHNAQCDGQAFILLKLWETTSNRTTQTVVSFVDVFIKTWCSHEETILHRTTIVYSLESYNCRTSVWDAHVSLRCLCNVYAVCVRPRYLWRAVNMHNAWTGLERVDDSTNRGEHEQFHLVGRLEPNVNMWNGLRCDSSGCFVLYFFLFFIQMRIS